MADLLLFLLPLWVKALIICIRNTWLKASTGLLIKRNCVNTTWSLSSSDKIWPAADSFLQPQLKPWSGKQTGGGGGGGGGARPSSPTHTLHRGCPGLQSEVKLHDTVKNYLTDDVLGIKPNKHVFLHITFIRRIAASVIRILTQKFFLNDMNYAWCFFNKLPF